MNFHIPKIAPGMAPEIAALAAMLLVLAIGLSRAASNYSSNDTVLFVNELPVAADEFRWFLENERPAVIHQMATSRNIEFGNGFWNTERGGTTPRRSLIRKTIERLTREKVEQELFLSLGILADARYSSFLKLLEAANLERKRVKQAGGVVYGPVEYSQMQFHSHFKATLQLKAKECLAGKMVDISSRRLRGFYEEKKSALYLSAGSQSLEIIVLRANATVSARSAADNISAGLDEILARLGAGQTSNQAAETFNRRAGLKVSALRLDAATPDRIAELLENDDWTSQILALPLNEWRALKSPLSGAVVRCVRRLPPGPIPFEDVAKRVKADLLDSEYDKIINDRISKAHVEINRARLDSITIE